MKKQMNQLLAGLLISLSIGFSNCKKDDVQNTATDVDQTVALKNVTVTYDSLHYELGLPPLVPGKSFQELRKSDSATYTNPENYSITLAPTMLADNTKANAADAKFDGMTVDIVDTIKSTPLRTVAGPFTVAKNTALPVACTGKLNLKTHRLMGLYIFHQIVTGDVLHTTFTPVMNYKIGTVAGSSPPFDITKDIPTRADAETKAFLQGLLDSGVFNKPM